MAEETQTSASGRDRESLRLLEADFQSQSPATLPLEVVPKERALTLLRDPALVARAQAISLTDEWEPAAASYFATQVGREGGNAALTFAFVEKHYSTLAAKTSDGGRLHLLPNAAGGFNDRASIDTLMAAQQARVGEAGLVPARRVAEQIREKAEVREREGQRLAAQLRTSEKRSAR